MKPKLFSFFLALIASVGIAYASVAIDGIAYNLNDAELTAEVTFNSYTGEVVIPASVTYNQTTYSVTSIGLRAFDSCSRLTSVTIPNSVTGIGEYAFAGCSGLTSVTIPSSVTSIGTLAFYSCTSLTSITIPSSVTSIGNMAFYSCTSLTSITIPDSVTSIGFDAFRECTSLTSIIWNAKNCNCYHFGYQVESFVFGNEVEVIPESLCSGMTKLTSITIPNSVISIGVHAFSGCSGLTSVTIGNSVTSIGAYAFRDCSGLTSVTIPSSVTSIGTMAFYSCSSLTSVTINGDASIGDYAFNNNVLTSLTFGNGITIIKSSFSVFSNLKNILFGSSVKVIEENTFIGCKKIEAITCYSMRPPTVNDGAFENLPYSTIVYVPADYLNTYKMHDFWGVFDVRPLGATSVQITDLQITPDDNTANVIWPTVENAATYEMIIKDKNGIIVCTLIFNANGQLTSIAFAAPGRSPASTQSAGFSFTVTGLDSGTRYDLTMTAKDNSGNILQATTKSFATNGYTAIDNVESSAKFGGQKILRDGHLFILRDGKTYTVQGQEVR